MRLDNNRVKRSLPLLFSTIFVSVFHFIVFFTAKDFQIRMPMGPMWDDYVPPPPTFAELSAFWVEHILGFPLVDLTYFLTGSGLVRFKLSPTYDFIVFLCIVALNSIIWGVAISFGMYAFRSKKAA